MDPDEYRTFQITTLRQQTEQFGRPGRPVPGRPGRHDQTRSNRSRFITLTHAATKSFTNFSFASSLAYTSATARSSEFDPKTRSTRLPVQTTFPDASRASKV